MKYSIVYRSSALAASDSGRLDADYFRPDYLNLYSWLETKEARKLVDRGVAIRQPKEIRRNYVDDGILFLRAQNVRPLSVDLDSNAVHISGADAERLKDNELKHRDILLTRTGANFGQCAVYLEDRQAIASSHTFIIDSGEVSPFLLSVFLSTKYGIGMINRGMYGAAQPELSGYFLGQILIPDWHELQQEVEDVYLRSHDLIRRSRDEYQRAQYLLISQLGLANWQPKVKEAFERRFSDIHQTGRFDAEYFQPEYDEVVTAIKNCDSGWDKLGNLVSMRKCIEVGSSNYCEEGIPFVRVSNLSPFEISEEKYISESLYAEYGQHQPEQGEILFSKDATPGIAHYLREQPKKMIPSVGILRLRSKTNRTNNECLTLTLNSVLTKQQAKRDAGGSVILHWRPEQISEIAIPIMPQQLQEHIERRISTSFALYQQSKWLLHLAKRSVELAVEEDETAAVSWLRQQQGAEG